MAAATGDDSTKLPKAEWVRIPKGLVLPRVSHSGEIALAGSRHCVPRLRLHQSFEYTLPHQEQTLIPELHHP